MPLNAGSCLKWDIRGEKTINVILFARSFIFYLFFEQRNISSQKIRNKKCNKIHNKVRNKNLESLYETRAVKVQV